ncbi:MAG TPA: AgmX/PglI C-terminal domain-containing protein [Anaeromyxobacter sp.]|nr:AgmX/PglI C-terminal domain-containing protein [Anaeromyxobacter sp.]
MAARLMVISIAAAGWLAGCAHAAKPSADAKGAAPAQPAPLGSIDKDAIRAVIQEHAPEMRSCWEKRLAADPRLHGKVAIRWVIEPDGSTSHAMPAPEATTLHDAELHACMTARIATWRFPRPKGGGVAVITYPWIFRTHDGAAAVQEPPAPSAPAGERRAEIAPDP